MTVHHPQEPQGQSGVTPPAATPGTGTPGVPGTGQRSAAPQEHLITPTTTPPVGQDSSQGTKQAAKDEAANVAGTAKEQAANVAGTAKDAGRHVADTAKDEIGQVAGEAKQQARQLLDQTMHEVRGQAKTQQGRVAEGMRTFGDDLRGMADGTADPQQGGMAAQLIGEVAQRASSAAGWLEDREPADLLDELRSFARRRPGTFIAIAGVTGLLVGRLAAGIVGEAKDERARDARQTRTTDTYGAAGSYGTPSTYGATDTAGTAGAYGATGTYGASDTAWTASGTTTGTDPLAATPVDNEPWLGERPAQDVSVDDPELPFTDRPGTGYPTTRGETGL